MRGDGVTRNPKKITHVDKNKEMDVFACRRDVRHDTIHNIVVELKHPKTGLGRKQINQIDLYRSVILEQPDFAAQNMSWDFFLIGKKFDESKAVPDAYANASAHGESYLTHKLPRVRVFVMLWCDIFTDFECRHKFLLEKLELDKAKILKGIQKAKTAKEIVDDATANNAVETATWDNPRDPVGMERVADQ